MRLVLLDTHVFIWYVNGNEELTKPIRAAINTAAQQNVLYLAAISLWEVSMLEKRRRIILERACLAWLHDAIHATYIQIVPITPAISVESCNLPGSFHEDPADRLIVATARVEGMHLFTRDSRILSYGQSKHIAVRKI
ncbi:MAG: hypothetical protein A3E83_03220 [Gammaproteobacteria bacterium RIFCSPHIGHO2_12_FULL_41_20]|nr:MAG: hypothetical protein A3E83_03220 [Gammaproteobacteria bacterium RIFCSPHIGHO2_12_FULL_41_20]